MTTRKPLNDPTDAVRDRAVCRAPRPPQAVFAALVEDMDANLQWRARAAVVAELVARDYVPAYGEHATLAYGVAAQCGDLMFVLGAKEPAP